VAYVLLRNKDRYVAFHATLYHALMCKDSCLCTEPEAGLPDEKGMLPPTGFRIERSFRIEPGKISEPLPEIILQHPMVKASLLGGKPHLVHENWVAPVKIFNGDE